MRKMINRLSCFVALLLGMFIVIGCYGTSSSEEKVTSTSVEQKIDATPYYEGKTLKVIVPFGPGGTYDSMARLVARHMPKHLPGNPTMIVENQPGGGGMTGIASVYNASSDGLTMGHITSGAVLQELLGLETNIDFKRFRVIGSASGVTYALLANK